MKVYEVYSAHRLEAVALQHAREHRQEGRPLFVHSWKKHLRGRRRILGKAYSYIESDIHQKRSISPAAEWIVDNYHLVQAEIQNIQLQFSSGSYKELPLTKTQGHDPRPRIYEVLRSYAEYTDCQLDADLLFRYLKSYQSERPLSMAELWGISTFFGIVLIEKLCEVAEFTCEVLEAKAQANQIADDVLGLSEVPSRKSKTFLKSLNKQSRSPRFIVALVQRLRFHETRIEAIGNWIEQESARWGMDVDALIASEQHLQGAANTRARNIITSLRLLSSFDWREFFEKISLVELTLRQNAMYGNMDFVTRDRYRHRIENLARRSVLSELEIARQVIQVTSASRLQQFQEVTQDPGYLLMGQGQPAFEKEIRYRRPLVEFLKRHYRGVGRFTYPVANMLISLLVTVWLVNQADWRGVVAWGLGFFVLLLVSEILSVSLNRFLVGILGPQHLPRYNLEAGIPQEFRTLVVVPTMLVNLPSIEAQVQELEIHYLTNPGGHVSFALLTDWKDADQESLDLDQALLGEAKKRVQELNLRHGSAPDGKPRFFLLHRRRRWNENEGRWMGWERKRGKLHELNLLLLNQGGTSFLLSEEEERQLPENVRFILTLDADTKLGRGAVGAMVGTLAHPLNQAVYDHKRKRVVEGYGILQPRITPALPSSEDSSWFQKLTTGPCGLDPYASAVSDIYQDVFGEGSFAGKGLYDLHIFARALEGKVPENSVLSHDLFEGNLVRCAFLNDIELYEEFPSHTIVAGLRQHRWIRGDWQLLPWLLGRGGRSLSILGRWKMLDNLRRSLMPVALLVIWVITLSGGIVVPGWLWVLAILGLCIHEVVGLLGDLLLHHSRGLKVRLHLFVRNLSSAALKWGMNLTLIPYHAHLSLDAVIRTLYRLFISHRNLLQWMPAAQCKTMVELRIGAFFSAMRGGLILALLALVYCLSLGTGPYQWLGQMLCVLWLVSPWIAYALSLPPHPRLSAEMHAQQISLLRQTARQIWHFFSTFVTVEENHLPPDNFQEDPIATIAHRSSPTNFGLYLLSILAARDFGWIGFREMVERWNKTLLSMERLPKYEGHFLNWYETTTGRPLEPRYVSSVDNGNLAGHLIVVIQACEELPDTKINFTHFRDGLRDTLMAIGEIYPTKDRQMLDVTVARRLEDVQSTMVRRGPAEAQFWEEMLKVSSYFNKDVQRIYGGSQLVREQQLCRWSQALLSQVQSFHRDYLDLFAWREHLKKTWPEALSLEATESWERLSGSLQEAHTLQELTQSCEKLCHDMQGFRSRYVDNFKGANERYLVSLQGLMESAQARANEILAMAQESSALSQKLFFQMDFGLLYDRSRKLFSIGLRVAEGALDNSYYDLLASEARLLSYVAIAKGDVPDTHWLHLGRSLTRVGAGVTLISWSGSMFEYLMPSLVLKTPEGSILKQACELSVLRQIEYGNEKDIPWGMSESAYHRRDLHQTYQYSNFGVPSLALKRGVENDLVVAPYATLMAAMYEPVAAARNLFEMKTLGAHGEFGFYEALDFTPSRLREDRKVQVVATYMAHHQGMALVALANVFFEWKMVKRFHAEPLVQAAELLLQEQEATSSFGILLDRPHKHVLPIVHEEVEHQPRQYHRVHRATPPTQLLSNGSYTVLTTMAGAGFSRYKDIAITRWREDVTQDCWGQFLFIRDTAGEECWSATYQPMLQEPEKYEVIFSEDRVRYLREDNGISSELEIIVVPDTAMELRRLSLTNLTEQDRELEVTSYFEVVLNSQAADVAHPAFSNLFVQTEYVESLRTLVASRRPRSSTEKPLWLGHGVTVDGLFVGEVEYETDRSRFLGRGQTLSGAKALGGRLTHGVGAVLDPVMSLRTRVVVPAGMKTSLTFFTGVTEERNAILDMAERLQDRIYYERVGALAWNHAQIGQHYLNIEPDEAHLYQRLATRLLFLDSSLRPSQEVLKSNHRDLTGLWALGISGDFPLMLVRIEGAEELGVVRQLLKAHNFFTAKNLKVDLVILNEKGVSYSQDLQLAIEGLIQASFVTGRGGIFSFQADRLSPQERIQLLSEARVVLSGRLGSLSDQLRRTLYAPPVKPIEIQVARAERIQKLPTIELEYFNSFGGFTLDGREYVIDLPPGQKLPPAPWINVISNGFFGFQVSESGAGYTWSENSRENQLTPWSNDPVTDPSGECFYLYDWDRRCLWSPTPAPVRAENTHYRVQHGQGYSSFSNLTNGISCELLQFVPMDLPVKISRMKLRNDDSGTRHLSVSSYVEWVLGFVRATMAPSTSTEWSEDMGLLLATNRRSSEFGHRVAFAGFLNRKGSYSGDRREFIGRNRNLRAPRGAWGEGPLSRTAGAGFDPCGAFKTDVHLSSGAEVEIVFVLGQASDREHLGRIYAQLTNERVDEMFSQVRDHWGRILGKVQVETPDRSFDLVVNRWLLYQTLSCRFWARAAFYQAGGAYGFRDQLQDSLALLTCAPKLVREHIVRAASRQFVEGDVQHWWHPPSGRGVRTHFSDDLLWLPFVVSHYLDVTEDWGLLEERVSYLEGPLLSSEQEDHYFTPQVSTIVDPLYEHCARALDRSLITGVHGLPLMGCGDWNDGMNRIGKEGRGESVWLGWFLIPLLLRYSDIAEQRNDLGRSRKWREHAHLLGQSLEAQAWDGQWYRRAFYDDGTPVGSKDSDECQIDSLAQTWSVISGAGSSERVQTAMQALREKLILENEKMVLLFTPPFDKTPRDPGYIKGYLPGVRENGGQYTHAATWCVIAEAMLGNGEQALKVFNMLNPVNHSQDEKGALQYKVEPYVLAGDVYSQFPHTGRGGWSWYTGASSWLYRAGVEYILGLQVRGAKLYLRPCLSPHWQSVTISYRYSEETHYRIQILNPQSLQTGDLKVSMDGVNIELPILLVDDGKKHEIHAVISPVPAVQ